MRRIAVLLAWGAALAATPAIADVKAGVDAWSRGDFETAVAEWRGPAAAGDADAQFNLGQAYKLGRGVPADLALAEEWYRKAALQGHPQAEENYGLALFQNGKKAEALPWLEKSAARGEPRSQFVLGTMLFNGEGVEKDWVRAYALVTRASAAGLPQASQALVQMDRYIPLADRQKGQELARRIEQQTGRPIARAALPPSAAAAPAPPPPEVAAPAPRVLVTPQRPAPAPPPAARPAARPAPSPARPDGGWKIQLGAFRDPANARSLWTSTRGKVSALAGLQPSYAKAGPLTRLLVGPFASKAEAARACAAVKRAGAGCMTVRN